MQEYNFYKAKFQNLTETKLLEFEGTGINGLSENIPIFSAIPNWQRIVVEFDITAITGKVTFKGKTSVSNNTNLSSSSVGATKQDGTNEFNSAEISAVGKYIVAIARNGSSNTVSNIGALLGFNAELTSANITGEVTILITT